MATEYKLSYTASDINKRLGMVDNMVKSVNGVMPDESGNVAIDVGSSDSSQNVDLTGYATEQYVKDYAQPKGSYLTEETDPTVPSWAKQPNKPSYTAAEVGARPNTWMPTAKEVGALPSSYVPPDQTPEQVGADPAGTADHTVDVHDKSTTSHNDLRQELKALSSSKLDATDLPNAINAALAQAKASGEFNYVLTESDKAEIVDAVLMQIDSIYKSVWEAEY